MSVKVNYRDMQKIKQYIQKHNGKLTTRDIFKHFENQDMDKNEIHLILEIMIQKDDVKFNDDLKLVWRD